jgi:HK97 family phage portal protein
MDYKAIEAIPGWYSVAKKAGELYDTLDAYEKVPMLHRAVNLRAEALGTVPYQLERGNVYVDYPFVTPLESLIQQTEKALLLFGHAFWLRLMRGRVLYGFQYLQPQSVRITFDESRIVNGDPMTGVLFSQQIGSRTFGPWTISEVVYFREPSVKDDIHAGTSSAQVALQSARLAYYLERFSSAFFEHGAQPALVMSLDKSITPPEYERLKSSWSRYAENVSNAFKTFFFRGEVNAQVITFPLKDLELVALQERTTTNIVTTFGVPRTMLEASAANYATADSDRQSFWRETIVPRLAFYERVLNSQLLAPLKYKIYFQPEQLSVFQTDEAARADSLVKLVQAGMSLDEAKYRLGYADVSEALGLQQAGPQPDATGVSEDSGNAVVDESLNDLATKRSAELGAFERKALKRLKSKGTAAGTTFESDVLPRYLLDYVELELKGTKKKIDVTQLFAWLKLTLSDLTPDERRVYRLIADKLAARVDDTAAAIAAGDYTRIDTDLRNILTEEVAQAVLRAGANRVTPIAGIPNAQSRQLVEQALQQVESSYLSAYWNPFLQDLSETERDYIARVVQQAQSTVGYTTDDIRNALSMFGDLRAQRIAFTEPTRAAAQQMNALQQLATQRGINTQRVWRIINDLEVCDECAEELDGTTEDVWAVKYPDGPPAHVNCRCVIVLQLMPSLPEVDNGV